MRQKIKQIIANILKYPRIDLLSKQYQINTGFFDTQIREHLRNRDTSIVKDLLINYCETENPIIIQLFDLMMMKFEGTLSDESEYSALLEKMRHIEYNEFTCNQWKLLRIVSISCGLFQAGNICRNKSLERALSYNHSNKRLSGLERAELLAALVDTGDAKSAIDNFNNTFLLKHLPIKACRNTQRYLYLVGANREKCFRFAKTFFSIEDKLYADYIEGKSVAIVGPAFTDENLGEEIDSFDVVIRLNYRGSNRQPPKEQAGEKVNVAYYGGAFATCINESNDFDFLSNVKCVSLRVKEDSFKQDPSCKTYIERTMYYYCDYFFDGTPTIMQFTLLDVLTFNPKRIKIFKTNFYASNVRYHENYYKDFAKKQTLPTKRNYWRSIAFHDFVSQRNLVRNIWRAGLCEVDASCEKILMMSNDEYVKTLEEIYAPFHV